VASEFTAHAKAILMGEHAVVYGHDALAVPLTSLQLTTSISPDPEGLTLDTGTYHGLFEKAPHSFGGIQFVVRDLIERNHVDDHIRITYRSNIPMTRGLGSSAASALATIRSVNDWYSIGLSEQEIVAIGNHAEDIVHGKASGLDLNTVNSNRLVIYSKSDGFRQVDGKLGAYLVISDTGQMGQTRTAVAHVHDLIVSSSHARDDIDQLGDLSRQAIQCWTEHDVTHMGELFNQAQTILAHFGISTPLIDQQVARARQAGALGSKLSGSGLGGVVISAAATRDDARRIADALSDIASGVWIEAI
jgi:mevalonate kinase